MRHGMVILLVLFIAGCHQDEPARSSVAVEEQHPTTPALDMESIRAAIEAANNRNYVPTGNAAPDRLPIDMVWPLAGCEDHFIAYERWWGDSAPDGCLLIARVRDGQADIVCRFASDQYSFPLRVQSRPAVNGQGVWIEVERSTRRGSHWFEIHSFDGRDIRELFRGKSWSPEVEPPTHCYPRIDGDRWSDLQLTYYGALKTHHLQFTWDPQQCVFRAG